MRSVSTLSAATLSAWAKSDGAGGSLSLVRHLADSASVAALVWDRWLPARTKQVMSVGLPGGVEDGRVLLRWLAGVHDVGKLSPAFACQVPELADRMHLCGLRIGSVPANRRALPHGLAGQVALESFLGQRGWSVKVARSYSIVVGSHHGRPPSGAESDAAPFLGSLLGDGVWERSRAELLCHVTESVGALDRLPDWRTVRLPLATQVLLTAAVIVSDWIASNQDLFPLDSDRVSDSFAAQAWAQLALPDPWTPSTTLSGAELFRSRFDLPAGARIRPLQVECLRLAEDMSAPGLMIVEAPMGEGKTEAALLVAEVLARRFGLGGVFVALPTMATSNAMFDRVHEWVGKLPDAVGSLFLAHGKAALNAAFSELRYKGFASIGVDCADDGVVAHAWYVGKKGPLANVVVGTVDQVLRGALKARHVMLRHLALVNKVVVIDEVHAADAYMSTYLSRCLEWLGAYRVPVVLMSATLPPAQRRSLLDAYQRGACEGRVVDEVAAPRSYPSVTVWPSTTAPAVVAASGRGLEVHVDPLADDLDVLIAELRGLLSDGGVAGIVCNTVARAQQVYTALVEDSVFSAEEVLLVHSRFVSNHRAALEDRLRSLLGPLGRANRPTRFVLVGTQVIEQSLDIDLDVLITDLAPVDLLLQRIGRLHRHLRPYRPARVREPRCLVRGVDHSTAVPVPVKGSTAVYGAARLLRAAAVLERQTDRLIRVPADIPTLVAAAYSESFTAPTGWEQAVDTADTAWGAFIADQQRRANDYLLGKPYGERTNLRGWLIAEASDDADGVGGQAQVRDAEDSIEAIVVQRRADGVYALDTVPERGGELIPTEGPPSVGFAKALAACTIRLPPSLTKYGRMGTTVATLENAYYPGWQQSPWLAGELVLELDESGCAELSGYSLRYDDRLGLVIER
ncbi:CRISPR-associated helicase Cas3' [Nocardia sp. SYP-A9097]|uniref:CRISPR-associated helicase Cas3' n=1 Tax=Nocardia sp. SYP-A9097 TaxID=2663237 RepID=UPI00129A20E2|nr:CRISPR-associated helicase Cas3' [Nocardia sp. SYP-A9097]MRH93039.1 CRISPR-associated helicase Cas3' [Nocardia sp. SYP-A9097]